MNNQQSYWYTGQVVTADQMTDFAQDLYTRFTQVTQQNTPCILNIGAISQLVGNVTLAAGSFRFANAVYAFLPYDTGIFGNAPAAVVAVTGNGFIVARYSVTPMMTNQTNYTFPAQYLFVASVNPTTDCVVCVITSGLISSYGAFFNYTPDIVNEIFTGDVTIGGRLLKSTNSMLTNNTMIGGFTPQAVIYTAPEGGYTTSKLFSTNGDGVSIGSIASTYTDGGDGNFKPEVIISGIVDADYSSIIQIAAADSSTNYQGITFNLDNFVNSGTLSNFSQNPDVNNKPTTKWVMIDASTTVTGIIQYYNNALATYMRPELTGNLSAQGTTASSIAVKGDFVGTQIGTVITMTQLFPNNSFIQSGRESLPIGDSSIVITLPIPATRFDTYTAIVTQLSGSIIVPISLYVSQSASSFEVLRDAGDTSAIVSFNWQVMGY